MIDQMNQDFILPILQNISLKKKRKIIEKLSDIQFLQNYQSIRDVCGRYIELTNLFDKRTKKIVEKSRSETLSPRKKRLLRKSELF
jgi:hypothetical protein